MRHAAVAVAVIVIGLPLAILLLLEPPRVWFDELARFSAAAWYSDRGPGGALPGVAGIHAVRRRRDRGNLQQESTAGLIRRSATAPGGGGIAQWKASWYAQMASWATAHGLSPTSLAGQLAYLAWNVRTSYPQLVSELDSASSPQEAATMFETTYEICSGYVAYMVVIPGSACNDPARRQYAVQAYAAAGGQSGAARTGFTHTATTCCPSGTSTAGGNGQLVSLPLPADEMLPGSWSYDAGSTFPRRRARPSTRSVPG